MHCQRRVVCFLASDLIAKIDVFFCAEQFVGCTKFIKIGLIFRGDITTFNMVSRIGYNRELAAIRHLGFVVMSFTLHQGYTFMVPIVC